MIYVEMLGRMGNQMFSYAHARYIQEKYPEQKIAVDFTHFKRENETWINYLQYFNCYGNIEEVQRKMNIAQKAMLRLFYTVRKKWNGYRDIYTHENQWAKVLELFDLYIFTNGYFPFQYKNNFKNKLLIGFFESDRYFLPIRSILQEEFKVKDFNKNPFAVALRKRIAPECSICVGVRKGDFTSVDNRGYCDICSPNYYEAGVELIRTEIAKKDPKLSDRKFIVYIFTDDVQWAQEHLNFSESVVYVTSSISGELKPWEMLQIMTSFRYYVIPNSSFFWWGQFLSQEENPLVVAPAIWRRRDQDIYRDIYSEQWLLLNPEI